jgi:hypothetical protein
MYHDALDGNIPVEWVTFDSLRNSLSVVGVNLMEIFVCQNEQSYVLVTMPKVKARKRFVIMSEKSKELRQFKTIDAAAKVCRDLGFSSVQVIL